MKSEFLEAIHDGGWRTTDDLRALCPRLVASLDPDTVHRFFIYRSSHWARVTTSLARSVYTPAVALIGEDGVVTLLREYFHNHRPQSEQLVHAALHIVDYCRQAASCADYPWVADLFAYCHVRWQLLAAAPRTTPEAGALGPADAGDSASDPMSLRLVVPAAVLRSACPLGDLLALMHQSGPATLTLDLSQAQELLLYRPPGGDVEALAVAPGLSAFAHALAEGQTLAEAAVLVSNSSGGDQATEYTDADELGALSDSVSDFVATLAQRGLLGAATADS